MLIRYKFNKVYGPAGFAFGVFLMILGSITVFKSWSGVILITLGALLAFTVSTTTVDIAHYRIGFAFELLGFIRIGGWMYVSPRMELLLAEIKKPVMVRCASNRVIDTSDAKYLIFLVDGKNKKRYLVCKIKSKDKAEDEIARLSDLLDIGIKVES